MPNNFGELDYPKTSEAYSRAFLTVRPADFLNS